MIGIINLKNLARIQLNKVYRNDIVQVKDGGSHNPFLNIPTENLFQLIQGTTKLNNPQSLSFCRYFLQIIIQREIESFSGETKKIANIEVNRVINLITN